MATTDPKNLIATGTDWDALVPFWHHFEHGGLNMEIIRKYKNGLSAPLLFVGGGRGIYAKPLVDHFGAANVVIVDRSMAMAARCRRELDLSYTVADLIHLPCIQGAFKSVVCSTGIIETLNEKEIGIGLAEIRRVLARGGVAFVACLHLPQSGADTSSKVRFNIHHSIDEWYHSDATTLRTNPGFAAYSSLAHDLGDRDTARRFLRRALPEWVHVWTLTGFATEVNRAGLKVESVTEERAGAIAIWRLRNASP